MPATVPTGQGVRFGVFELDVRAGELRKRGLRVPIQGLPIQLLTILLESPGLVVTREELRTRLWPADTFVDFDHSLHNAIARLREALRDDANNPRFIETLPRRGYRFVAPVDSPATPQAAASKAARRGRFWRAFAPASLALIVLVAVLVGFNVGGVRSRLLGKPPSARIQSIAVLPLKNLSNDPEQDYFADGMTEALITGLAKVSALRVISRTSVMRYKDTQKPLPEIAQELQVDALVEGTVARSGDRVRITANLVQASPERHLWAERYERDLRDVLALQSNVASSIVREIRIQLTPVDQQRLASVKQVNPEAYEAYLKGLYSEHKFTIKGFQDAIESYQQAIEKDPGYGQAYAGLADAYVQLAGRLLPPREVLPKAKAAALKALQLDDKLAEAHTSLGFVKLFYEFDWSGAEREYKRAIELNPGYPNVHTMYGAYLSAQGRFDDSLAELRRRWELEPVNFGVHCGELRGLYYARRYDEAIEEYRRAHEQTYPKSDCIWLGMAYEQKLRFGEAIALYQESISISPGVPLAIASLGHAYALAGKQAEARKVLNQLLALAKERYVSPYDLAILYIGLGDNDQALKLLDKAVEGRLGLLVYLNVDPVFDPLRSDPRFQDLLRRIGLPP